MSDSLAGVARLIDEMAISGCPAAVVHVFDGWLLRYHFGLTRRANSVWPNRGGELPIDEKLAVAEEFYRRRGAVPRFQVSPFACPADLDKRLERRGYSASTPTQIQTIPIASILAATEFPSDFDAHLAPSVHRDWLHAYQEAEVVADDPPGVRKRLLEGISPRAAFAVLRSEGEPAAVGIGLCDRGWVGAFAVATVARFRRRRAATGVMRVLAEWGDSLGAKHMYLQVGQDNRPAMALYEHLGFQLLFRYHYRELP